MLRVPAIFAAMAICAIVLATCARPAVAPPGRSASPETPVDYNDTTTAGTVPAPSATPEIRLYAKLRVFVASESTDSVWVMEAAPDAPYTMVGKIPVGRLPHQMAVAPNGKYVAVNNRMANSTSIIDPVAMKEIIRIPVGKQPHGIAWSADGATLFVAHEKDNYISAIEAGTWKASVIIVGTPQHVLIVHAGHPNELWFTVTNSAEPDHLRVYDLAAKQLTKVKVQDVHDAYFTPDGSEIWSSSSGFLTKPSDRMVIYDPIARKVKQEIRFAGRYPFHSLKPLQDGMYTSEDSGIMVLSDHLGPSLLWVDWRERHIVAETKLGKQPFHSTYDPEGDRMLVTTNVDGMVNVISVRTRLVIQQVPVTKAHGIVSVGIRG